MVGAQLHDGEYAIASLSGSMTSAQLIDTLTLFQPVEQQDTALF